MKTPSIQYKKIIREWIAYKIATLKNQKKAKLRAIWLANRVEKKMPDTLLMSK